MNSTSTAARFVGWRRYHGSRWFTIGEPQESYAAAWAVALAFIRSDRQAGDATVLAEGLHPADRPERRRKTPGLFASSTQGTPVSRG